jgi:hypothetical protein
MGWVLWRSVLHIVERVPERRIQRNSSHGAGIAALVDNAVRPSGESPSPVSAGQKEEFE